jgi:DNA (cytosine-5)-methyltransferase 1
VTSSPLTAVDIFSGGGGLTVGLKKAGFKVVGAVEIDHHAFSVFKANHAEVRGFKQDVRSVSGKSLTALSADGNIDLVAGCPPCQGFTSLTAKYRRDDPRNYLIFEIARLVREIQPVAVMVENVPGLAKKGKPLLDYFIKELESLGYRVSCDVLQVADFGVPQSRRRLVILAGRGFSIPFPSPTHSRSHTKGKMSWKTVHEAIYGLPEPIKLEESMKNGGPQRFNWHVIRTMSPANRARIKQSKPGSSRNLLPDELRPECHKGMDEGFSNVYGRMSWDQPSVTITAGCTTFSKGRFGHPSADRTISVLEAALLQTFPADYFFDTPYMERVCNIVGNALPCLFAEALANEVRKAIFSHHATLAQAN